MRLSGEIITPIKSKVSDFVSFTATLSGEGADGGRREGEKSGRATISENADWG
jgi:hypothetical protein